MQITSQSGKLEVRDAIELHNTLDRLDREAAQSAPFIVEISSRKGEVLSIGIGRDVSVACFIQADRSLPSFISLGADPSREPVEFLFDGESSEYRGKNVISKHEAIQAVLEFFESNERPKAVKWDEC